MLIRSRACKIGIAFCLAFSSIRGSASQDEPPHSEVVLRLGNESNPVDGVLGPYTYGGLFTHEFQNSLAVEAGYIRMHEPDTPAFASVLDEAQITVHSPKYDSLTFGISGWRNRMIDMYTSLGGLEVSREGSLSISVGLYLGTAEREVESGNFRGVQLSAASSLGAVALSAGCLLGMIDRGKYRKCSLGSATGFLSDKKIPIVGTLAIEDRYFKFGDGGSASEPKDEFILIAGLEFHLEKISYYTENWMGL